MLEFIRPVGWPSILRRNWPLALMVLALLAWSAFGAPALLRTSLAALTEYRTPYSPSNVSGETTAFFHDLSPRLHLLWTPVDASWLNQTESLLEAFSERYLLRGSWRSRVQMICHIMASPADYNQHFAHPFDWNWSCRDFQYWLNNTPGLIRCKS